MIRRRFTAVMLTLLAAPSIAVAGSRTTEGVSPGAIDRIAVVESRCPTFSWGADVGAAAYELVAYALPEDASQSVELTANTEVLYTSVAGSATGWTPSMDQCFDPGRRYVWFVRAVTEMIDDQVVEAGEWSVPRYFEVPAGPTAYELAHALDVLKRWEAAGGSLPPSAAAVPVAVPAAATVSATDAVTATGTGTGTGSIAHLKSVQTAPAAIKGHNPEVDSEAYGVIGTTSSLDGAGVAAANLEGYADLILDGTVNGATDARISEWGLDRSSSLDETFVFLNSGTGSMEVVAFGGLRGDFVDVDEVRVSSATVIDDQGSWLGQGDTIPCTGCVTSPDVADLSIGSVDLADDAVTGTKIADGAVSSAALRSNAVTSAHIADGAVTSVDIQDGTVTASDVDVTSAIYVSKSQLYEIEETSSFAFTGTITLGASCNDTNDLPLAGSCKINLSDSMHVRAQEAVHWDDPTQPAEWKCLFRNDSGTLYTVTTGILCIAVP